MSNFRALAHVLAGVKYRLETEYPVTEAVGGALVDIDGPSDPGSWTAPATVRLFAYHVVPNPGLRGSDLPTRGGVGSPMQRPAAALDLHFLVSCYGTREALEPERLFGFVASVLHAYPVLTASTLEAVATGDLAASDLASQTDRVTLTPLSLTLEDMNRLWGTLTQTPYVLSMAWQASALLLHRPMSQRRPLPVRTPAVAIESLGGPFLTSVANLATDQPISSTSILVLTGKGLRGETTRIQIGATTFSLTSGNDSIRATTLHVDLSQVTVTPGIHPIRVVHPVFRSNALPLVIQPTVEWDDSPSTPPSWTEPVGPATTGTITVHVYPALGANQRARLHLSRYSGGVQLNYSLEEDVDQRAGANTILKFVLDSAASGGLYDTLVGGSPANRWIVRVEVDGVFSVPIYDEAAAAYDAPWVDM